MNIFLLIQNKVAVRTNLALFKCFIEFHAVFFTRRKYNYNLSLFSSILIKEEKKQILGNEIWWNMKIYVSNRLNTYC